MSWKYPFQRYLSYLYPITLETHHSDISGKLELSLQNGKLVLDAATANYSYGSLHTVFQEVIQEVKFTSARNKVLILGFGAGSIASILKLEKDLALKIDGVELDPVVIELFNTHFKANRLADVNLIQDDVIQFLKSSKEKYDYIFIDVFENLKVPSTLLNQQFIDLLQSVCYKHTQTAMNTMLKKDDGFVKLWNDSFKENAFSKEYDYSNLVLFARS